MHPRIPSLLQRLYPRRIWKGPETEKSIYLTFDDGPIPEVTPWVLQQLRKYAATATFFCIGDNVQKHPAVYRELIENGHTVGNHTFHHLNGWRTSAEDYLENVRLAEEVLHREDKGRAIDPAKRNLLFRPPYGRLGPRQAAAIEKGGYRIVMWDVLSLDYAASISSEKCFQNVVQNAQEGSIVVFHDSLKAEKNLKSALPKVLHYFQDRGFRFKSL